MTTRNHWLHELSKQRGVLVHEIDDVVRRARGEIKEPSLKHIESMRDESLRLFLAGETLASMWAGQAAWEGAASLNYFLGDHSLHQAQWKRIAGGKKGADIRKAENVGSPKRDKVIAEINAYKGKERSMASAIAKRAGCDPRYVRQIKAELSLI